MGIKSLKKLDSEAIKKYVTEKKKDYKIPSTEFAQKDFTVEELSVGGYDFLRIMPRGDFSGNYLFYLYSSYLCFGIESAELQFILGVAKHTNAGVFIPLYPLAPEHGCREVFDCLKEVYSYCTTGMDYGRLVLMGSSHGAGLALSMSLVAWKEGLRKPDQIILLSPANICIGVFKDRLTFRTSYPYWCYHSAFNNFHHFSSFVCTTAISRALFILPTAL